MESMNPVTGIPVSNMNEVNPNPGPQALSVTGILRKSGKVIGYRLSDGQTIDKGQGVRMAKSNQIRGVAVATNQGTEYLRALPDGNEHNNLSNLPIIL